MGVEIEDTIINKITAVKYTGLRRPTLNPFWDTIRATSPRVIIPTPIFNESAQENLHNLATSPHPMILQSKPTKTKAMANTKIERIK